MPSKWYLKDYFMATSIWLLVSQIGMLFTATVIVSLDTDSVVLVIPYLLFKVSTLLALPSWLSVIAITVYKRGL